MKIALVGGHRTTRLQAPYTDDSWEIWAMAPANRGVLPRHGIWFELHSRQILYGDTWFGTAAGRLYLDWLTTLPHLYTRGRLEAFPLAVVYPERNMLDRYGPYFFTSTVAWMIALALGGKPDAIGLWGIEMASGPEYTRQRAGLHHFVQLARDLGIEIVVSEGSGLLDPPPLYGLEVLA